MTPAVTVVGSGASGVHFALTLLKKGVSVRMLDVGRQARAAVLPDAPLNALKEQLADPVEYFLGGRFQAALLPDAAGEYYGLPPSKDYVFDRPDGFDVATTGFAPLFSFAQGGLAQAWTGGAYPLNDAEISEFPIDARDLTRAYDEVAARIGITGEVDDLTRFLPAHAHLLPPIELDEHSARLVKAYGRQRERLNRDGVFLGRTRVATLSRPLGARQPCTRLGRCLWGCPTGALYTPSLTLGECLTYSNFEYRSGVHATHLKLDRRGWAQSVVAATDRGTEEIPVDRVAFAAGALASARLFLRSMLEGHGVRLQLRGLMDNRQMLVPFINLSMIGRQHAAESYQYHLLGLGLEAPDPRDYVHAQITTLKTALLHPLIQRAPLGLAAATRAFRSLHAALGLVNVNFRDVRRESCHVRLSDGAAPHLYLHYEAEAGEPERLRQAVRRVTRALRRLNCLVPPGMVHMRPMGASVHYAGLLPMTKDAAANTAAPDGRSRDIPNLLLIDGVTFPFLPAKNITFTLMANAVRIAEASV